MELQHQRVEVETGNTLKKTGFRIDLNAKTVQLLNDPYTDKVGAVIREISCNALDAHREANNPNPIRVHMPNTLEPWFAVTDDGTGISPDDMEERYTGYGVSTKDTSNNYIGAFGIGRFSALAYGESFTLISRHKATNTKNFYIVSRDDQGIPELSLSNTAPLQAHEVSGFEVRVPVRREDMTKFIDYAAKFYANVEPTPVITGAKVPLNKPEITVMAKSGRWAILKSQQYTSTKVQAAMGPVRYLVNVEKIGLDYNVRSALGNMNVELYLKMGEVATTISREELSYTPATIAAVKEIVADMIGELRQQVSDQVASAPTLFEAKKIWQKIFDNQAHGLRQLVGDTFIWKGKEVTTSGIACRTNGGQVAGVSSYDIRQDRVKIAWDYSDSYSGDLNKVVFLIDDLHTVKPRPNIRAVLQHNYETAGVETFLLRPTNDLELQSLLDQLGNPEPVIKMSTLPVPPKPDYSLTMSAANPKKPVKIKILMGYGWEEATRALEDGGTYLPIHGLDTKSKYHYGEIRALLYELSLFPGDLYGIPATVMAADKMAKFSQWKHFDEEAVKLATSFAQSHPIQLLWSTYVDYVQLSGESKYHGWLKIAGEAGADFVAALPPKSPLLAMHSAIKEFKALKLAEAAKLFEMLKIDMSKALKRKLHVDLGGLQAKAENKYPMLKLLNTYDVVGSRNRETIINYIKAN